jgi:mono/diheme cytochrome c family protein
MRSVLKAFLLLLGLAIVVCAIGLLYFVNRGVSAKEQPGQIEEFLARRVRNMAIARHARSLTNPVKESPGVIADGRAHFADPCASCHANDGSGKTAIGPGLWPKAPDMRQPHTQNLTDGELFWIIENGIRFTGMPAWSTGTGRRTGELASRSLHQAAADSHRRNQGHGIAQSGITGRSARGNSGGGSTQGRRRAPAGRPNRTGMARGTDTNTSANIKPAERVVVTAIQANGDDGSAAVASPRLPNRYPYLLSTSTSPIV